MREKTIKLYKFDELSDEAKREAMDWYREINLDYEWYDNIYDYAKQCGEIIGIDIDKIHFSGFSFQGDGACFTGSYSYAKKSVKAIMKYAPQDKELHTIALELQREQRKHFYNLSARMDHRGFYYHSGCMMTDVYKDGLDYDNDTIVEQLRYFADWIYSRLEEEYDFLNSDEQIAENIRDNEYEFLEDGTRA